jgi:hypothetical protein
MHFNHHIDIKQNQLFTRRESFQLLGQPRAQRFLQELLAIYYWPIFFSKHINKGNFLRIISFHPPLRVHQAIL